MTDDLLPEVRRLRDQHGWGNRKIAEHLNVGRGAVNWILRKLKLEDAQGATSTPDPAYHPAGWIKNQFSATSRMDPAKIDVGIRHRQDMGDIDALARDIDARGLLHPVVLDARHTLIAGERRLKAWERSKFAGQPIPYTIVPLADIVAGEWAENAQRKDFTPSEAVAIKRALEPQFKEAAAERQREHGGTAPGRRKNGGEGGVRALDQVAGFVGRDRKTIVKAEEVVAAAEAEPERFGKLVQDMDRTGNVSGPHRRLTIMRAAEEIRAAPPPLPMRGPYQVVTIDFPWPHEPEMEQEELDKRGRSLRPYPPMSIKAGCKFMVEELAPILHTDCVVYFWTTNFHMPYAFRLLEALGFPKHSTIGTWVKSRLGRGQVLRDKTEHCIIAKRGKVVINLTTETTDWSGPGWESRENSRKPEAFYRLVEKLTPAPRYASIFSTGGEGELWDGHGDQVGRHAPGSPQDQTASDGPPDKLWPAATRGDGCSEPAPALKGEPGAGSVDYPEIPGFLRRGGAGEEVGSGEVVAAACRPDSVNVPQGVEE